MHFIGGNNKSCDICVLGNTLLNLCIWCNIYNGIIWDFTTIMDTTNVRYNPSKIVDDGYFYLQQSFYVQTVKLLMSA